jgi:hypothetical protein
MTNFTEHDDVFEFEKSPIDPFKWRRDLRTLRSTPKAVGALLVGIAMVGAVALPVGATGILPPSNPNTNLQPTPNFLSSGNCRPNGTATPCSNPCVQLVGTGANERVVFPAYSGAATCTTYILRAINSARTNEQLPALVLPSNFYRLSPQERIFVVVDLERTARGLPPYLGLNRQLHASAQAAAIQGVDPSMATNFRAGHDPENVVGMGSTLASGYNALEADYVWMYEDGWGGSQSTTPNLACTSLFALGCWGHRDQLLGYDGTYDAGVGLHCTTCEMGTGFAFVRGTGSFTSLIELPAGRPPHMYFTWAKDVLPFLPSTSS